MPPRVGVVLARLGNALQGPLRLRPTLAGHRSRADPVTRWLMARALSHHVANVARATQPDTKGATMTKYRKTALIEATQWFKNGDHPDDGEVPEGWATCEGKVVRYFAHPDAVNDAIHDGCGRTWHDHGWIDDLEGGHNVCPGDWIATGSAGEYWAIKPNIFAATYEEVV